MASGAQPMALIFRFLKTASGFSRPRIRGSTPATGGGVKMDLRANARDLQVKRQVAYIHESWRYTV